MISFLIFAILLLLAIHAWMNYASRPSVGRFIVAMILTFLALPTLIGAIFKVTIVLLVVIAAIAVVSAIVGVLLGDAE
jgi:hypothetical protein